MTDASDIYRRFVEAPLRLKTRTPSPSPPSTPPASSQQNDASDRSPWGDSPAFSTRSKEIQKLRRRVGKIKLFGIPRDLDDDLKAATASDTESSAGTSSFDAAASKIWPNEAGTASKTVLKKKKRVTRSVSMNNENTGEDFMDTPTRCSKPPKRLRKYSRDLSSRKESGSNRRTSVTITLPLRRSRRLQYAIAEPPIDPAARELAELISTYCDALLATNTISGCFFALSWNALRGEQAVIMSKSTLIDSKPLQSVFSICHGIAKCEKLAQHSFHSKSPKTKSPKLKSDMPRRRSSGKITLKSKKTKKSVHFRSFDLSCLNLQYVEDEQVAVMVDKILSLYGTIMAQLETILSCVMASPSRIYSSIETTDASKKTYRRAFGGRDLYSQHEIRISGEYFARQFANLLHSSSSPPQFLQGVFSSLASSSVRFKLRVLFIESEDFGDGISSELESRVLLDDDGKPFPAMAPYEHQDLGAAIHWALQESVLYWPLVQPLNETLKREGDSSCSDRLEEDSPVKTFLDESAAEDLDHMEKYVLARRFLRFHLTKSWRQRLKDNDIAETWTSIEKVCALAKRFHFEDEAHLFPLASVEQFVSILASEEPTLRRMEKVLQSFYEQKYGTSSLQPEPCMECHHLITREEISLSIRCTTCARRFHLACLHLPESFTQYAEHYTCPACFLGRGGY
ncbi:uncharacterized protein PITG_01252 [Phytophthora infestans T30-4]|uniref:Zinc finger PHD-type domain-containing protein n=1 Tax=Phytophthora infestans (strain T30-4) TaxID=403677 RepID=D0MV12_PHYIT|nr:uncharacterized protein PITG_01252 [Phytophthora infestans T30-4]EEY61008.1 conserved hypothetical protein [Phytophthora infestans T30-4]|eukprot:XP_002907925.1 conserved hypothetical protein [Phytophthora infestans T30-4]